MADSPDLAVPANVSPPANDVQLQRPQNPASDKEPAPMPVSIDDVLCDDTYFLLKRHFLMKGKGKRPQIPTIANTTHRVLCQLNLLREEDSAPWNVVVDWFWKLFSSQKPTAGQLEYRIKRTMSSLEQVVGDPSSLREFLNQTVDFNELPSALANIGLTKHDLLGSPTEIAVPEGLVLTNSIVCELEAFRGRESLPAAFTIKVIKVLMTKSHLNDGQIRTRVNALIKHVKTLKKKKATPELEEHLKHVFCESSTTGSNTKTFVPSHDYSNEEMCQIKTEKKKLASDLGKTQEELKRKIADFQVLVEEKKELQGKLLDQENLNKLLCAHISSLKTSLSNVNEVNHNLKSEIDSLKKSKFYKQNHALKKELLFVKEKSSKKQAILKEQMKSLKKKMDSDVKVLAMKEKIIAANELKLDGLKKKIHSERAMKSKIKCHLKTVSETCSHLESALNNPNEEQKNEIEIRESGRGKRFSNNVRLAYMELQGQTNVSAKNCWKVVEIVSRHLFNKKFSRDDLPKDSSAIKFQDEAHVISKCHAADEIHSCNHFMYANDGTSRQKRHYLEQHIVLDSGKSLSLGFSEVASDNAETLLEKSIEIFKELSQISSEGTHADQEKILKDIIKKMKCLMSDRASVMKAFDRKMLNFKEEFLSGEDASTHFLFCNAHFLIGLASAVEEGLKALEREIGERLGRDKKSQFSHFHSSDPSSLRIIRMAAEVLGPRGDEKSGCRHEWLAFCSERDVKSLFSSFRANRFNNVFQNAFALIYHHSDILTFLSDYCTLSNQKLQSVLADMQDSDIVSAVAAMALLFVFFTEPYWQLMQSQKTYADFPLYARRMEERLNDWESENVDICHLEFVFHDFSNDFLQANIHNFLSSLSKNNLENVKKNFIMLVTHCKTVFKRQLADVLDGGVFGHDLEESVVAVLKTCPLTNLIGERLFGDLDFDIHRRRNTSLHLHSTKVMWNRNKTASWLKNQNSGYTKKLVAKAIMDSHKWRQKSKENEKCVMEKIKNKMKENKQRRLEKDVALKEKKAAIMDQIIAQGGVCSSKEEVDGIMKGPKALENLKAQINFRRLCRGESIQVSGTLSTLYHRLLAHLGESVPEKENIPRRKKRKLE